MLSRYRNWKGEKLLEQKKGSKKSQQFTVLQVAATGYVLNIQSFLLVVNDADTL